MAETLLAIRDHPISTLMQTRSECILMDADVRAIEAFFADHERTWAPVVGDGGEIVGVISESDIARLNGQGSDALKRRAWQISTYRPVCVPRDARIGEVAQLMVEHRIHHVVIAEGRSILGVVSSMDFVRLFS